MPVTRLAEPAGAALGALFGGMAALRGGKPVHPDGHVYGAVVRRTGSPRRWGSSWLDDAGEDRGIARLSRAAGLPEPLPDVHGLAVSFTGMDGRRHDVLLATTGLGRWTRFALRPTRRIRAPYGSLMPYQAPRGHVLLAAVPVPRPLTPPENVMAFRLLAATPTGPWRPFGSLELSRRPGSPVDDPVRFDPVRHLLPGLRWPPVLARLREPAYAAARRTAVSPAGHTEA
ncbi:hypothetical protein [Jiangella aurantiaca]|uniref:hypothetical protein n=1 Tax=Jiangella aurantiaca TaxID=2530373 RepID=UPI00193D70E8|nr:hypothetical protein [Jiangella aurantiaca]